MTGLWVLGIPRKARGLVCHGWGSGIAKLPHWGGTLGSQPTVRVVWEQSEGGAGADRDANSRKPVGLLGCELPPPCSPPPAPLVLISLLSEVWRYDGENIWNFRTKALFLQECADTRGCSQAWCPSQPPLARGACVLKQRRRNSLDH